MNIIKKIKHWIWFRFIATENEKAQYDLLCYGNSFMKSGKRINPKVFYIQS